MPRGDGTRPQGRGRDQGRRMGRGGGFGLGPGGACICANCGTKVPHGIGVPYEFPEGIITYLLLIRGGFREKTSLLLAFLAAALTTPLGMLVSYPYISRIDKPFLGALLAFSGGALVYVGATHLLPQAETEHKRYSLLALTAGILVAVIIIFSKTQGMPVLTATQGMNRTWIMAIVAQEIERIGGQENGKERRQMDMCPLWVHI